ncbi:MAG: alpha/beta hydrolase [Rhodospirillales bacterium]
MSAFGSFTESVRIQSVKTSGAIMRVAQVGKGPDIVWVPGGDSPAEAWRVQMTHFADRFRSTSYDPRGVGETESDPAPWSIADFARDCAEMIEQLCKPPVILSGLSMGGLITQQVAIDYPHLVRLAVPMGTAAYIDGFTRDWMQAEIDIRKDGVELPAYFLAPHYAAYALPAKVLGDPAIWEPVKAAYRARFAGRKPQDLIDQWEACLAFDCREGLKTCPVPVHAISFSEDVQTPPSMVKVVADLAPNGHFYELPGLGHVSVARHAQDEVNALLRTIFEAAGPPPA